jgi:hypothetical protein
MAWLEVDSPVAISPRMAMPQNSYTKLSCTHFLSFAKSIKYIITFAFVERQGVPKTRAEIIPIEPDAGNADEGRQINT